MAEQCWEILNADLAHWAPWTRFFGTSDQPPQYFVIDADTLPPPGWVSTVIRRPTCVLYCTDTAGVTDLNPDHCFAPETTPEEAVALMGYELIEPKQYEPPPVPVTNGMLILSPTVDQGATA